MRDACVGGRAQICGQRRSGSGGMVWVEEFYRFVRGTGEKLSVFRPANTFDDIFMCLGGPCLFSTS